MDTPGAKRPKVKLPRDPQVTISVYMPQAVAENIVALALKERRTLSQMAKVLIGEALKKRGVKP
jgi:hypothetical protein